MLESYRELKAEFLAEKGVKLLICDIDNTLVTYDDAKPTKELLGWFTKMNDFGVRIAFVSNNHADRVSLFNEELGFIAYADSGKPKTKNILKAMVDAGCDSTNTVLLGDQLLTDAAGGKRAGLFTVIVPPIKDKKSLFFKSKRLIEKPYVKKYKKLHSKEN